MRARSLALKLMLACVSCKCSCVCHTNAFGEISCPSHANAHNQTKVRACEQASIHTHSHTLWLWYWTKQFWLNYPSDECIYSCIAHVYISTYTRSVGKSKAYTSREIETMCLSVKRNDKKCIANVYGYCVACSTLYSAYTIWVASATLLAGSLVCLLSLAVIFYIICNKAKLAPVNFCVRDTQFITKKHLSSKTTQRQREQKKKKQRKNTSPMRILASV